MLTPTSIGAMWPRERSGWLIRDLLAYTQVLSSTVKEDVRSVEGNHALDEATFNLKGAIESDGARVIRDSLPCLLVKEFHLVQLLQNAIGDAIKCGGERPPVIEVTAAEESGWWRIWIRDKESALARSRRIVSSGIFKRLHRNEEYG